MSKVAPLIIMLLMLLMLIVSWSNVFSYTEKKKVEYNEHIAAAEAYMEKEIYIDAVKEYEAALKLCPDDYEVSLRVVELYQKLGDNKSYIDACQKAIDADKTKVEPYIWLSDYYIENGNYTKAYKYLKQAVEYTDENEEIIKRINLAKSQYTLVSLDYDTFSGWLYEDGGKIGYAKVSVNGEYGLLKSDNKSFIKCNYDDIGPYMNDLIPVQRENEYYYITKEGYRKLVTDRKAEYLGAFTSSYAPAKIDGMYGYIDKKTKEYHFEYDYAGCFMNGIAAVKKGDKWGVIDTSFKEVTGWEFDEILMDEYGICSAYGVFWAKNGDRYYLYNKSGEKISDGFEDVKLFASNEDAAFKQNGKWGFINKSGEITIEATYENADSFNLGYAPFCKDGKWGCIDKKGNILIEPTFEAMKAFSKNGYAYISDDGITKFLVINLYE